MGRTDGPVTLAQIAADSADGCTAKAVGSLLDSYVASLEAVPAPAATLPGCAAATSDVNSWLAQLPAQATAEGVDAGLRRQMDQCTHPAPAALVEELHAWMAR